MFHNPQRTRGTEKEKEENIWRKMCGPRRKRKRKRSKTFGEKYLARGAEDEQRRKMKKIWRRKIDGDTDNQNQQSTNWVNIGQD